MVYGDSSRFGLGCVLMQNGKVISYTSRHFKVNKKNYATHDLKLDAVIFALKYGITTCLVFMLIYSLIRTAYNIYSLRKSSILHIVGD